MNLWQSPFDPIVEARILDADSEERIESEKFRQRMHDAFLIVRNAALVMDWNIDRALEGAE